MIPWLSIWFSPQETIRQIVEDEPAPAVVILAVAAGIAQALLQLNYTTWSFDPLSIGSIIFIALVGAVLGLVGLYLGGWLYRWIGSWFGGQAKTREVRAALAWSQLPVFAVFALWLVIFVMAPGWQMISSDGHLTGPGGTVASVLLLVAVLLARVWQLILLSCTLAAVHRVSVWKGFVTLIIPLALMAFPFAFGMTLVQGLPNVVRGGDLVYPWFAAQAGAR